MKALLLAAALAVVAVPRIARADGWFGGCDENHDGHNDGCDSDMNPDNGYQCSCAGSSSPASIGVGLGLTGLVVWRIGRKRRR